MPYIASHLREKLAAGTFHPHTPGELNFCITKLITGYVNVKGPDYQGINDVLGALEGAKLEFYRRVVVPYEDTKIKLNGDVY